jgi:DNA-directed RNA polymerase specialized sigma24 family protein
MSEFVTSREGNLTRVDFVGHGNILPSGAYANGAEVIDVSANYEGRVELKEYRNEKLINAAATVMAELDSMLLLQEEQGLNYGILNKATQVMLTRLEGRLEEALMKLTDEEAEQVEIIAQSMMSPTPEIS